MVATRADRLVSRPVEWWWRRRLPRGKLVILAGDPGLGKSFLLTDLHARASTGTAWPDEAAPREPVHSIILSAEDGAEDTIKLRLDGQGADGSKIHLVRAIRLRHGGETVVSLDQDLRASRRAGDGDGRGPPCLAHRPRSTPTCRSATATRTPTFARPWRRSCSSPSVRASRSCWSCT